MDLNILNRRSVPMQLARYRALGADAKLEVVGALAAGAGVRVESHERERWVAREHPEAKPALSWEVDIAGGILQDIVLR